MKFQKKYWVQTKRNYQSVTRLSDKPWRWTAGIQSGIAIGFPMLFFTFFDQQIMGFVAALGGFSALYFSEVPFSVKVRRYPFVLLAFILAGTLGALTAPYYWLYILALVVVAAVSSVLTQGLDTGPPGSLLFVLVTAICGHLVQKEILFIHVYEFPLLILAGGGISCTGLFFSVLFIKENRLLFDSGNEVISWHWDNAKRNITVRVIIGCLLSGLVAYLIDAERSYWVVITSLAILQASHTLRLTWIRAFHRLLGTFGGLFLFGLTGLLGWWVSEELQIIPQKFQVIIIIMVLQCFIEVVIMRNYGLGLLFITPLALTIASAGNLQGSESIIRERWIDTLWGSAVAVFSFWFFLKCFKEIKIKGPEA